MFFRFLAIGSSRLSLVLNMVCWVFRVLKTRMPRLLVRSFTFAPQPPSLAGVCVCVCHLRKGISVVRGGGLSCQIISIKLANCI